MADLRDAGYRTIPLDMLEEACADDSPTEEVPSKPTCPPGCRERVPPLQPSSSSSEHSTSSDEENDEEPDRTVEGSEEETQSQRSDEETRGEEGAEEDDDDDANDVANEEYPSQDNVVVSASTSDETKTETLLDDNEIVYVGTYDDEIQIIKVKCTKEVGTSKPSLAEHIKRSPSSSQKPFVKRTIHERSPQP